jgi:methylenetetrahydrofolate dehydrogenase (NADP+) / methenyltetrahydrofolate cyclohydrolase
MTATVIDGKAFAARLRSEIAATVATMVRKPGLAVVLVGDDPASVSSIACLPTPRNLT